MNMNAISINSAQNNLDNIMDQVCGDRLPIVITRSDKPAVIIMSLEDYQSLEETAYLMRSPNNAKRLIESISALEKGQGTERELLD